MWDRRSATVVQLHPRSLCVVLRFQNPWYCVHVYSSLILQENHSLAHKMHTSHLRMLLPCYLRIKPLQEAMETAVSRDEVTSGYETCQDTCQERESMGNLRCRWAVWGRRQRARLEEKMVLHGKRCVWAQVSPVRRCHGREFFCKVRAHPTWWKLQCALLFFP